MVFAERYSSHIKRKILPAFAKTHATAMLRQHAHTAERYQQFWKISQNKLFPNMETIIFA
jgi:hypothetical protein